MSRKPRLQSIDLLRGIVMVLMALDHTRDYFGDMREAPEDLATTTLPLFLTRWVTHFCAPVFVLLAGTSAYLYGSGRRTRGQLSWFLASRGLWLVLLELTLVKYGWVHSLSLPSWIFQVIATLGVGMLILAALIWLPRVIVLGLGLAIVFGHNAITGWAPEGSPVLQAWWELGFKESLYIPVPLSAYFGGVGGSQSLFVIYPFVPWLGVMLLGYALGPVFRMDAARRRRVLLQLGAAATALFLVLRASGGYGDPSTFEVQDTASRTLIDFLNCAKYPPSLQYLLMTLGPALLFLGLVERAEGALGSRLVALGRVPLFFYVAHIHLIHVASRALSYVEHGEFFSPMQAAFTGQLFPEGFGHGLGVVYLAWALCVAALAWPCLAFARLKRRSDATWLSYL